MPLKQSSNSSSRRESEQKGDIIIIIKIVEIKEIKDIPEDKNETTASFNKMPLKQFSNSYTTHTEGGGVLA